MVAMSTLQLQKQKQRPKKREGPEVGRDVTFWKEGSCDYIAATQKNLLRQNSGLDSGLETRLREPGHSSQFLSPLITIAQHRPKIRRKPSS